MNNWWEEVIRATVLTLVGQGKGNVRFASGNLPSPLLEKAHRECTGQTPPSLDPILTIASYFLSVFPSLIRLIITKIYYMLDTLLEINKWTKSPVLVELRLHIVFT